MGKHSEASTAKLERKDTLERLVHITLGFDPELADAVYRKLKGRVELAMPDDSEQPLETNEPTPLQLLEREPFGIVDSNGKFTDFAESGYSASQTPTYSPISNSGQANEAMDKSLSSTSQELSGNIGQATVPRQISLIEEDGSWGNLGSFQGLANTNNAKSQFQSIFSRTYSKVVGFKRKAVHIMFNGHDTFARPDTASDQDIMTEAFANKNGISVQRSEADQSLFLLGDSNYVKSVGKARVPIRLFGSDFNEEFRWFHVLKKCPVPVILGMNFVEKIKLYTKNKHLLVDCPFSFGSLPSLKWLGSPRGFVNFRANGKQLVGCADTGSDLDFMSPRCAKRLGLRIDTDPSVRSRVMLADESIVETVGQVRISSVEVSNFDSFEMSFHVLPGLASDVIFSEDFLDQMDAFNTCAQIKDTDDLYQQRLNTLISLGPIQAFLNRTWTPDVADTAQQEHDQVIEAEIYRRNNVKRSIRKMRDEGKAAAARVAEETKKSIFDQSHARCPHCIGETGGMTTRS